MNRKLSLDLDALVVETFETENTPGGRGTVRAHAYTDTCGQRVCGIPTGGGVTCNSCQVTCLDTCEASCQGTCEFTCNTETGMSDCNSPFSICVCTPGATCIDQTC